MAVCAIIIADSGPVIVIGEAEMHLKSFSSRVRLLELYMKYRLSWPEKTIFVPFYRNVMHALRKRNLSHHTQLEPQT